MSGSVLISVAGMETDQIRCNLQLPNGCWIPVAIDRKLFPVGTQVNSEFYWDLGDELSPADFTDPEIEAEIEYGFKQLKQEQSNGTKN